MAGEEQKVVVKEEEEEDKAARVLGRQGTEGREGLA